MRKFFKNLMIGMMTLVGGFMTSSCDNSLTYEPNPNDSIQVQLVHTPDVVAWSGQQVLGSTFGTRTMNLPAMYSADPNSNMWENVPTNITEEERNKVMDWFSTHQYPESISLNWTNFYVQQLGYSEWECTADDGVNKYTGKNQMNQLAAGKEGQPDEINNFNGNTNFNAIMKMVNSSTENFSYKQASGNGTRWYDKFIIICIDGEYYVGFDFVSDGQNANERVKADGYYNDWIVKITNADKSTPENPNPQPNPETPEQSDEDTPILHNNEVEVNFSINDSHYDNDGLKYNNADLWTKLSIHVRHATNVKITIPLEGRYLCESDDFAIFQNRTDLSVNVGDKETHINQSHTVEYTINGNEGQTWKVSLTTTITKDEIIVETSGINGNTELIEYLYEKNKDGVNFEVWFYFQTETVHWVNTEKEVTIGEDGKDKGGYNEVLPSLSPEDYEYFQTCLNKSTIEFKYSEPNYYINAFGKDENGNERSKDCSVNIVESQINDYFNNNNGYHLNSTKYNYIWVKNGVNPDDLHPGKVED